MPTQGLNRHTDYTLQNGGVNFTRILCTILSFGAFCFGFSILVKKSLTLSVPVVTHAICKIKPLIKEISVSMSSVRLHDT